MAVFATDYRRYINNAQITIFLANEIAVFATDYGRYIINDQVALLLANEIAVFWY